MSSITLIVIQSMNYNSVEHLTGSGGMFTVNATTRLATDEALRAARLTANVLTGALYPHHPVVLQANLGPYPFVKDYLAEWNGLRVPAQYDCDMFNGGHPWGLNHYFAAVPSRRSLCWQHYAADRTGALTMSPTDVSQRPESSFFF